MEMDNKENKTRITAIDSLENIVYVVILLLAPFVFYLAAHFTYLFKEVKDEDLSLYLEAEKRYSAVVKIWLLTMILIMLVKIYICM